MRKNLLLTVPLTLGTIALLAATKTPPEVRAAINIACKTSAPTQSTPSHPEDTQTRTAAQRGLDYLATAATDWQSQKNCFGCHVQGVTLEALAVGTRHDYTVDPAALKTILAGVRKVNSSHPSHYFAGAAFARYDQEIGPEAADDLVEMAEKLVGYQKEDGSMNHTYNYRPVAFGQIHGVYMAAQTWRQAYALTADDRWLAPLRKAEIYLVGQAKTFGTAPPAQTQELSYAIMGLAATGVTQSEATLKTLTTELLERQQQDGGWGFTTQEPPNAFATGQALYALRGAGFSDTMPQIERGRRWLVERQTNDGSWSSHGFGKAEAMWGVLGLVSLDVVSIQANGLVDGRRVDASTTVHVKASDNSDQGVTELAAYVDDVLVAKACEDNLTLSIDPTELEDGIHIVELVAKNRQDKSSRRRFVIYTGDTFFTEVGSRFTDGGTRISLRNLAATARGTVEVRIHALDENEQAAREIAKVTQDGQPGAMRFFWNGQDANGKPQPRGRYLARISFVDDNGRARQTEELLFAHTTKEAQTREFGEVKGQLDLADGRGSANTWVELVDEDGRVIQRARTTNRGTYRFKNVNGGQYKVRVNKRGFVHNEANVTARPGTTAEQTMSIMAQ